MNKKSIRLTAVRFTAVLLFVCIPAFLHPAYAVKTNLRVGFNTGFELYQTLDDEGNPQGIHIDLMNAIAAQQEFSLEYLAYDSNAACYEALESGEIDVILGAPMDSALAYDFRQTDALSSYELCLMCSNETAREIEEKGRISGFFGAIEQEHSRKVFSQYGIRNRTVFTNNTYYIAGNQKEILDWLIKGKVSLAVCEKESAIKYFEQLNVSEGYTVVINYLVQADSTIMVRGNDVSLFRRIESGLAGIRSSGDYTAAFDKWIESDTVEFTNELWKTILVVVAGAVIAVLIYVVVSARLRALLRKQVANKTLALQQANESLEENLLLLSKENEFRNDIIQNSSSAAMIIDDEQCVSFANRQVESLIEISVSEIIGQRVDQLPLIAALLDRSMGSDEVKPMSISLDWKGSSRTYRCNRFSLPQEQGTLFMVEDITTEEQEKQFFFEAEKNRVLNTVIAGIAHEIKNPLTAIRAYASLIPTQTEDKEFMESFSRFVPKEADRINALIESLINYARPSQSQSVKIDLGELVNTCVGITAPLAQREGIKMKVVSEEGCIIFGSRDYIQQAIINYLLNSIEAVRELNEIGEETPPEPVCIFVRRTEEKRVQLEILDKGIGMNEEQLKRCMDPFYTTKAKGTGLGMAVARQRLYENGGETRVFSEEKAFTRIIVDFREGTN